MLASAHVRTFFAWFNTCQSRAAPVESVNKVFGVVKSGLQGRLVSRCGVDGHIEEINLHDRVELSRSRRMHQVFTLCSAVVMTICGSKLSGVVQSPFELML